MDFEIVDGIDGERGIKHKKCGLTSFHPRDVENRYCGHCHEFLKSPDATEYEDTIICPWCGHRVNQGDLFEFDDGTQECESCGEAIEVSIHYAPATYGAKKAK